jgi:NAD(P)-dependent dehydrogenase (short-subunit alcohol dehydrogenase family)
MANELAGKFALVTGVSGSGQIGIAVAQALADHGASLAIEARNRANVKARAAELRSRGARVLVVPADLTSEREENEAIERMIKEYGRLDILVNLAGGLSRYKPAVEHSFDDWQQEMSNNLLSSFLCSRAAFIRMRDGGGAGLPQANKVAYNCAKAGIEALTRTLALEGCDTGIRANAVAPGLVDTESDVTAMQPKDLKRWTKREDIAQATVFLASDASGVITGQVLAVTGWGI